MKCNEKYDVAQSIKEANKSYGEVYYNKSHVSKEATSIAHTCLTVRSRKFILDNVIGTKILETCCAQGTTASWLVEVGYDPICFDISPDSIRSFKEHHPHIRPPFLADAERLPLKNNTFDTVIFNGALHHLPSPRRGLSEAYRVLKNGGRVIICEPNNYHSRLARSMVHPKSICNIWNREGLENDGDDRWIKPGVMDTEISLPYVLRVAKSVGLEVLSIHTCDIAVLPYRLFNPDPTLSTWTRLEKLDFILKHIPVINRCGETMNICLSKAVKKRD